MSTNNQSKLVREALSGVADSVSCRNGVWTARRGFYYHLGGSTEKFVVDVRNALLAKGLTGQLEDSGEVWKPFKGGASLAKQSHWFVKFNLNPVTVI